MSDRKIKISALLKELAAKFIQLEANTDPMITVTNVDLSPDFKRIIIFVTTIPSNREPDAIIFLKRNATDMRNYMKKNARIKTVPHLEFMIDAGERHRQNMDELVKEIKKQNEASSK